MADNDSYGKPISPVLIIAFGVLMAGLMATALWYAKRPETALIYGLIRDIQFPFINELIPYDSSFRRSVLEGGFEPSFNSIYINSAFYGAVWSLGTMVLMFFAVSRLSSSGIKRHVQINSRSGRKFDEIMDRYATNQPHVQFFRDYDVLALPTTHGTARQAYTPLELLVFSGSLRGVILSARTESPARLDVDKDALKAWYHGQFGPENPFLSFKNGRLDSLAGVENAVVQLRWDHVLVLYPALRRLLAFYVESDAGFEFEREEVERIIDDMWSELNGFKTEFRDGIELGYATPADRAEREARYLRLSGGKSKKKKGKSDAPEVELNPYLNTEAKSPLQVICDAGQFARTLSEPVAEPDAVEEPKGKKKKDKATKAKKLRFFGEVLAERGPDLKCVEKARDGLVDILSRHLGSETERFPVRLGPDRTVQYARKVETHEEAAFNQQIQEKLNVAMRHIADLLLRHKYQFGVVGSALEKTRESGIMPPNLFRFLRFSEPSQPLWWFVHNLGMPSAVPEVAGLYEHYTAERLAEMPLSKPFLDSAAESVIASAESNLTRQTIDNLRPIVGPENVRDIADIENERRRAAHTAGGEATTATRGDPQKTAAALSGFAGLGQGGAAPSAYQSKFAEPVPVQVDAESLAGQIEAEHDIPAMDALLGRIVPNQAKLDAQRDAQKAAEDEAPSPDSDEDQS